LLFIRPPFQQDAEVGTAANVSGVSGFEFQRMGRERRACEYAFLLLIAAPNLFSKNLMLISKTVYSLFETVSTFIFVYDKIIFIDNRKWIEYK